MRIGVAEKEFEEFVNDVTSENKATSYSNAETLEINGRKAVKYDYVIISETRKKVGYIFCMDTSDIQEGKYFHLKSFLFLIMINDYLHLFHFFLNFYYFYFYSFFLLLKLYSYYCTVYRSCKFTIFPPRKELAILNLKVK